MKVLFLTTILLSKNCNGGEVASQWFIDAIRHLGHQVTVVGYLRKGDVFKHNPREVLVVDERYTETSKSKFYSILWLGYSFLKNLPYSSAKYYSAAYIALVKKLLKNEDYDHIIIDHAQIGWIEKFIKDKSKLVTIAHNIEHEIYRDSAKKAKNLISKFIYQREANLIKAQEESLSTIQQVWTLTEHDKKYFSQFDTGNKTKTFVIVPSEINVKEKVVNKFCDIGLLGSWSWQANIEALEWFLDAVYPHLPTNLSIHIAGKGANWLDGKYPNIIYCGVVPDAQEFMAHSRVVAIPTLSGGGIQIKTLDAITSGSFVVATTVALRGISHLPSTVKIANNPEEFASSLVSSVALSSTQKSFEEAKKWYQQRRDKFHNDLADALDTRGKIGSQKSLSNLLPLRNPRLRG
jgi:polysaccharide biosynthesis protein PslH